MSEIFTHYVGIDWSGARGDRLRGLAVSLARPGFGAPSLVTPESAGLARGHSWSRALLLDWIRREFLDTPNRRAFVGMDSAFSLPFFDRGAFLPGCRGATWQSAPALWRAVDAACADDTTFYGRGFVEAYADHFHQPGNKGMRFERRFRMTETHANDGPYALGRMESPFHLVGPSQVGLSALSSMRILARLAREPGVAFWPFMPVAGARLVLAEIFCTYFVRLGQPTGKIRDCERLNDVLANLDSQPVMRTGPLSDHDGDAVATAAGLRMLAGEGRYWNPRPLVDKVRRTEGWVFGIV